MADQSRRTFLKGSALVLGAAATGIMPGLGPGFASAAQSGSKPKVYFTRNISPESLLDMYARVSQPLSGKIAVKLHTGEPNGPYIIPRPMIMALMANVPNSSVVECNVLYDSPRQTTEGHRQTLATNGWDFCPVDIMDEDGDTLLPIPGGRQLKEVSVGSHLLNYDSMLVLTHFKGHPMSGFGGSLKNISIGCASGANGKRQIHSDGKETWVRGPEFLERIVEGGKAVTNHFNGRMAYINVLNNMSVDCDCMGTRAAAPTSPDIGILASTDILAVDQASIDLVYALPEAQKHDLVERIESRHGLRQLTYMKEMGMGSDQYELVTV